MKNINSKYNLNTIHNNNLINSGFAEDTKPIIYLKTELSKDDGYGYIVDDIENYTDGYMYIGKLSLTLTYEGCYVGELKESWDEDIEIQVDYTDITLNKFIYDIVCRDFIGKRNITLDNVNKFIAKNSVKLLEKYFISIMNFYKDKAIDIAYENLVNQIPEEDDDDGFDFNV